MLDRAASAATSAAGVPAAARGSALAGSAASPSSEPDLAEPEPEPEPDFSLQLMESEAGGLAAGPTEDSGQASQPQAGLPSPRRGSGRSNHKTIAAVDTNCLNLEPGTWGEWSWTFAVEFFSVALVVPLVIRLVWCMTRLLSSPHKSESSVFTVEFLTVEVIKRVPQGVIAYTLLIMHWDDDFYEWIADNDFEFVRDPTFKRFHEEVLLSEAYYPCLAFVFVALLRAHDMANFKHQDTAKLIMQRSSMRKWRACLRCIQKRWNCDCVNNTITMMDHEEDTRHGFVQPTTSPDCARYAELQKTYIEGFHFERFEVPSAPVETSADSADRRWCCSRRPAVGRQEEPKKAYDRWQANTKNISSDGIVKKTVQLRDGMRRTDARGENGTNVDDTVDEEDLQQPVAYLPAHSVAEMIVQLSHKDGQLHHNRGKLFVRYSSLLHAAIPFLWRISVRGACHESSLDWVNLLTLTGWIHVLSFLVNYTTTVSIAIRMLKCYEDFYVRYRRMLYLLHLCPWSTMKQSRRVDAFGMLPTFHLNSMTNIAAWNKLRIFLQRFEISNSRRVQTAVVYMLVAWVGLSTYQAYSLLTNYMDSTKSNNNLAEEFLDTASFLIYSTTAQLAIGLTLIIQCGANTNVLQENGFEHMLQVKQAEVLSRSANFLIEHDEWQSLHELRSDHVFVGTHKGGSAYTEGENELRQAIRADMENPLRSSDASPPPARANGSTATAEPEPQSEPDPSAGPELTAQLEGLQCYNLLTNLIHTVRSESTSGGRDYWAGEDRRAKLIFIHLNKSFVAGLWTSVVSVIAPGVYVLVFGEIERESAGSDLSFDC
eukprot:COSAG04_NODE_2377_length_4238_cov_4.969105_5_plen_824_part_00